jgi:tRNA(His) 5'-end guanylyltransferase
MTFDELNSQMRSIEAAHDRRIATGVCAVARMDGRGFTRLTKERHKFDAPFGDRFCDYMVKTTEHLMNCGFRVVYGYTQSDEISLLFHPDETNYGRSIQKCVSVLAGEASAKFSLLLGDVAVFDARVCELHTIDQLIDYFRWRAEDAYRNSLSGHCYWALRNQGLGARQAADCLEGMSAAQKRELLMQVKELSFDDLPGWQRRGIGLYWDEVQIAGTNPRTGQRAIAIRRRIKRDFDLAEGDAYAQFVVQRVKSAVPEMTGV